MRTLLLGTAAIALSGCSFLGLGGNKYDNYNSNTGYYGKSAPVAQAPKSCDSGNCLARWNLEGGLGTSFIVGGDSVTGEDTNFNAGTAINQISTDSAYDTGWRAELGASYALAPNTKITGMVHVDEAESAGRLDWGTLGGEPLSGALSDYKSYGAELGLRQYFAPRNGIILNSVRPYVEGRVGATKVKDINIIGAQAGATALPASVPFLDGGVVPTAAALIGIETPLTRYSTIGLETGIRYHGNLDSDNSVLEPGSPLAGTNNGGSRTTIPLMLRGRYRF